MLFVYRVGAYVLYGACVTVVPCLRHGVASTPESKLKGLVLLVFLALALLLCFVVKRRRSVSWVDKDLACESYCSQYEYHTYGSED